MTSQHIQLIGRLTVVALLAVKISTYYADYRLAIIFYCLLIQALLLAGYAKYKS